MTEVYQQRLNQYTQDLREEEVRSRTLGWTRLVAFLVAFGCYVAWDLSEGALARGLMVGMILAILAFLVLVVWHRRVRARRRWAGLMVRVNEESLARVGRDWGALPASGDGEPDVGHPYAFDLDVCGPTSLFRLLTTVTLPPGRSTLRQWLLEPASPAEVRGRQLGVAELAPSVDLRQNLEARGRMLESPSPEATEHFLEWAEGESWTADHRWVLGAAWVLPLLTALLIVLQAFGIVDGLWWLVTTGAGLGVGSYFRGEIHPHLDGATAGQEKFGRYAALLSLLLDTQVEAPILKRLKSEILSSPVGAEEELRRLDWRLGWADIRENAMAHAPLQALLVWDVHVLASLEKWKARSGPHVRRWLETLGELEALAALAALKADNPDWTMPTVSAEGPPRVEAEDLGHPLLPADRCVRNNVNLGPDGTFLFLTGSNMSGKSTLLRAVGMNVALAQAGGPVAASRMELTPLRIHTSMRTADSLAEGVSQYMVELQRIRGVVQAAWGGALGRTAGDGKMPGSTEGRTPVPAPVLYLLDEPLQGTNEAERRVAVQTILGHLLDAGAVGAVATHDLKLDETDRLRGAAQAVHLEGTVREGNEGPLLSFDYRLKPGRATSTNALALLRAVGLGARNEQSP